MSAAANGLPYVDDSTEEYFNVKGAEWPDSLLNGSLMGAMIRSFDWASTPLGPIESWIQSLRTHVSLVTDTSFPMYMLWGTENIVLYNDAYMHIAGSKHPDMLGRPAQSIWNDAWSTISPLLQTVKQGHSRTLEDCASTLERQGRNDEAYFTLCYSPLRSDDGIVGISATLVETTQRVLALRRIELLRQLAFETNTTLTEAAALQRIRHVLEQSLDLSYIYLYLAAKGSVRAQLAIRIDTLQSPIDVPHERDVRHIINDEVVIQDAPMSITIPIRGLEPLTSIGGLVAGINPKLPFDPAYREFITLLATHIGNTIISARVFDERQTHADSLQLTHTIEKIGLFAESGQQLFWVTKPDGYIDWYHQSWYDYTGQTYEEAKGSGWQVIHHPDDIDEVTRRWNQSLQEKIPFEMTFRLRGKDGYYRWFLTRAVPELNAEGQALRWYGTNTNIDAERRATQQLDILAHLGDQLVQTLDRDRALQALSDRLVPDLADWTLINIADASGTLILVAACHRDPKMSRLLEPFIGTSYDRPNAQSGAARVYHAGRAEVLESVTPEQTITNVIPAFGEVITRLGLCSAIVVPIMSNGKIVGTFHGLSSSGDKKYVQDDLPFFQEIGRRIGFALHNADTYEREAKIAHAFQNAALPNDMPTIPGLHFSSLYEPANSDANIGGDFYDAFRLLDGRVVISIGDVLGSGLDAAATMAALRQSIRAAASINPDPDLLLKAADRVFADSDSAAFASAFVAVIDPLTFSIQYANAGHPAPILRLPDGTLTYLGGNDLLLGISANDTYEGRRVSKLIAASGSLLVLYTDGLTEATHNTAEGERLLAASVTMLNASCENAADYAQSIHDTILGKGGSSNDDVAILSAYFHEPLLYSANPDIFSWQFSSQDGETAHQVGCEISTQLQRYALRSEDIFSAQMIFSELVGNVVRYAGMHIEVVLDLTQTAPVLHVIDSGEGFSLNPKLPVDFYSERGRGLYIVMQLAREFISSPRTMMRGSHARAVLCGHLIPPHTTKAHAEELQAIPRFLR